jgi:hypothetical protein
VVEVAGAQTLEIEGDVAVPDRPHRVDDGVATLDHVTQSIERHLDTGGVVVVTHPQLGEPETTQRRFGPFDLRQQTDGDGGAVGHARSQASSSGLVPGAQPECLRRVSDHRLGEPGIDQREHRTAFVGGALTRSVVVEIVEVHTEHDGRVTLGRDRAEHIHERGLAVEAAIDIVAAIVEVRELVGHRLAPTKAPLRGQRCAVVALVSGQRR